jgi:hypothetical protein
MLCFTDEYIYLILLFLVDYFNRINGHNIIVIRINSKLLLYFMYINKFL